MMIVCMHFLCCGFLPSCSCSVFSSFFGVGCEYVEVLNKSSLYPTCLFKLRSQVKFSQYS